ncbi:SDR family NAD(P)-dependent oxidoreductase [Saccharopolyspora mangrovi]|uniref:SDR family NAD(P)-dependent oxidoreductase n=1 Tax=Saccharopolyspora mangrovi TaxID=3082379 RepID=A0ABU6A4X2_9PSEU|nr:SDR family NAD(P)-dependent oxidoreductase [Saccharopolyspora sp. S2-29]MEB3366627.1 SDR family NAD(P)-dependent oxidoreductase [Saccharopolyspora sp. S2-29]
MSGKTWFITGASRGFGRVFATAALDRGDRVAATARNPDALAELVDTYGDAILPLTLDVTNRAAAFESVHAAQRHFGALDVVINNAGYGLFGFVEETSEKEAREQIETNLFGTMWVTQAALPIMREQRSGHIIQISSFGGIVAVPHFGAYVASKWAVEGLSDVLAQEVAGFGIHVTVVEPAGYATDWGGQSAKHTTPNPAYDAIRPGSWGSGGYDPSHAGPAMLEIVDAKQPPRRVAFGSGVVNTFNRVYADRIRHWEKWEHVSDMASGT